jgi:hypothetical protein
MSGPWIGVGGIWVGMNSGYQRWTLAFPFKWPGFGHHARLGLEPVTFTRSANL